MLKLSKIELKKIKKRLCQRLSCVSWRAKTAAEVGKLYLFRLEALNDDLVPIPKVQPADRVKPAMLTEKQIPYKLEHIIRCQ